MIPKWYLNQHGTKTGPFTVEELRRQGIKQNTLVWSSESSSWVLASEIPELKDMFYATPPPASGGAPGSSYGNPGTPPPPPVGMKFRKYYRPSHDSFIFWCVFSIIGGLIFLRFFTPFFASIFESYIWARMSLVVSGIVLLGGLSLLFLFKEGFYKKWIVSVCIILAGGNLILMNVLFREYDCYGSDGYASMCGEYYKEKKFVRKVRSDDLGYHVEYDMQFVINRFGIKIRHTTTECDLIDDFPKEEDGYVFNH